MVDESRFCLKVFGRFETGQMRRPKPEAACGFGIPPAMKRWLVACESDRRQNFDITYLTPAFFGAFAVLAIMLHRKAFDVKL